jgi:hypothetical protein
VDSTSKAAHAASLPLVVDTIAPWPFKGRPFLFEIVIFALFAMASCVIASYMSEPRQYLGLCLPVAVGLLSVPFAFRFAHRRFIDWARTVNSFADRVGRHSADQNDAEKWVLAQLSFFAGSAGMYWTGLGLLVWTLLAFYVGDYFSNLNALQIAFFCILTTLSAFLAGLGLYAIYEASRLIWRLGDGTFRISVKAHKFGVLGTGRMLGECYFVIALVCMVYYTSAVLGQKHLFSDFKYWNPPMLMLVLPTAGFILFSFISCQVPIHRQMVIFKKNELARIEHKLDQLKLQIDKSLTSKLREDIKFYEDRRVETLSLPEWPFGFRGMLGAVGSSITVVLPTLLGLLAKAVARSTTYIPV